MIPHATLFRFEEGGGLVTRLTSSEVAQKVGSDVFLPAIIDRGEIKSKNEITKQSVNVMLELDNEHATRWYLASADTDLFLTIYTKDGADVTFDWSGRLTAVTPAKAQYTFVFESVFTILRKPGLRQRYQRTCNATLYGAACKAPRLSFRAAGTITAASDLTFTIPEAAAFDDGYFSSGMFEDMDGGLRFVTSHVGDQIQVSRPVKQVLDYIAENGYTGLTCGLYPGCDKQVSTCKDRFNNLDNFRGFHAIPKSNPFDGSSIV